MFTNLPKLNPRLPSPTSFDGVKPSYVEWSEELLTYLSGHWLSGVCPILHAVTGHKDVITKNVFIEGVLSEIIEEIKNKNLELEAVTSGAAGAADPDQESGLKDEVKALNEKKASRAATLMKAHNFLRYVLFHSTSGDPNIIFRRDVVTGLEIWRQMAVTYVGSTQTRVVTLLKQIMTSNGIQKNQPMSFRCIITGSN